MAAEILIFGGSIDGELPLLSSHASYFGGQPARFNGAGVDVASQGAGAYATVIGLFKNDSTADSVSGPQVNDVAAGPLTASVIFGANKVRLTQAAAGNVFAFPATAHAGAWQLGDEIYVNNSGVWDNQAANGGDPPCGRVVYAPTSATDNLEVYMYPRPPKI
jgi:hypothetical protein